MIHKLCLTGVVEVWGYGITSNINLDCIGHYYLQDFGPKLKSQLPEGHLYVQGCPGRYGSTCLQFQKFCIIHRQCLIFVVEVLRYGITSHINLDLIGLYIQDFGPKLKSQPPGGHIYVQGCPGRYGITCPLFQKCCMIHRQYLTCLVEVLGHGITSNINLDWIRHYYLQDFGPKLKSQPPEGHIYV